MNRVILQLVIAPLIGIIFTGGPHIVGKWWYPIWCQWEHSNQETCVLVDSDFGFWVFGLLFIVMVMGLVLCVGVWFILVNAWMDCILDYPVYDCYPFMRLVDDYRRLSIMENVCERWIPMLALFCLPYFILVVLGTLGCSTGLTWFLGKPICQVGNSVLTNGLIWVFICMVCSVPLSVMGALFYWVSGLMIDFLV